MQCGDGLVAKSAFRLIDDAFKGEIVSGLRDQPQIGDGVTNFGALVEAKAADDLIIEADGNEALFELPGLELGPHEDCDVVQRSASRLERLDLLANPACFFRAVPNTDNPNFFTVAGIGPQGLAEPPGIVRDQAVGGSQDVGGRAVILLEPDN